MCEETCNSGHEKGAGGSKLCQEWRNENASPHTTKMTKETHPKPKRATYTRGKKAKRRTMLESSDLRWKAGRESKVGKVTGKPLNSRLIETDLGLVHVSDSRWFQRGLQVPVWCEPGGEKMYCKGRPRQLSRY